MGRSIRDNESRILLLGKLRNTRYLPSHSIAVSPPHVLKVNVVTAALINGLPDPSSARPRLPPHPSTASDTRRHLFG